MALQSMLNTTQVAAPRVRGGALRRASREKSCRFTQHATCGAAARGGASALAETKLVAVAKIGGRNRLSGAGRKA